MAAAQNNLTTEQINDPRVRQLLEATEPLSIRLAASFWATAGWTPDMPHYNGKFNPKGWICKKRGELRVLFDEESGGTTYKTTITTMLQHGLTIVEPTQRFYDDSSAPSSPDENVLVSQLGGGRAAAATARARMSQLSPVSGRGSSLGSPNSIGRGGDTDSSTNSSPFGEQRTRRSSRSNSSSPSPSPSPAARSPTAAGHAPADRERDSSDEEQEALEEERTAFGTKFTKTTKDRHQPVQALTWTLVDSKPLKDDIRKQAPGVHSTEFCAQLLNLNGVAQQDLDPYSAFKHMTPQDWIPRMAARANEHLHDVPADQNYRKTTSGELEL